MLPSPRKVGAKRMIFWSREERVLSRRGPLSSFSFRSQSKRASVRGTPSAFDLAGRDGEGLRVDAADGLAADADKVIVSVVHGALRRAAGLAHPGEAEGLEGAAGVPELHHLRLPADVQPVQLRVEVFQHDHPGVGTFSGAFPEFLLLQERPRCGC